MMKLVAFFLSQASSLDDGGYCTVAVVVVAHLSHVLILNKKQ